MKSDVLIEGFCGPPHPSWCLSLWAARETRMIPYVTDYDDCYIHMTYPTDPNPEAQLPGSIGEIYAAHLAKSLMRIK